MVQKTFLHEIMKILIISFGVITNINYVSIAIFDLMPDIALELLHKYPSMVCSSLKGFGMPGIIFFNSMVLIILRAYFNCYPYYLFNMNEKIMWIVHGTCNLIYVVKVNTSLYQQNQSTCNVDLIEMLKVAMNLDIDKTKVRTYKGLDPLTVIMLLLAPLAELLSRIILKLRSMRTKSDPGNKYRLTNDIQFPFKTNKISTDVQPALTPNQIKSESVKPLEGNIYFHRETIEIVDERSSTNKGELISSSKDWPQEACANQLGEAQIERKQKAKKIGGKIIKVGPVENLPTISETIAKIDTGNQDLEGDIIIQPANPTEVHLQKISRNKKDTDSGLHGFLSLTAIIFVFIIIGFLRHYDIVNKETYDFISTWINLKTNRLVNALLPLHWLLRKQHSKDFAIRKLKIWKDFVTDSLV